MRNNREEALHKLMAAERSKNSIPQNTASDSQDLLIGMPEQKDKTVVVARSEEEFIVNELEISYADQDEFDLGDHFGDEWIEVSLVDDQGKFDLDKYYEIEEYLEQSYHKYNSISSYLRPEMIKKPKIASAQPNEKRGYFSTGLSNILVDENLKDEDMLNTNPISKTIPLESKSMPQSKDQYEKSLSQRYNVPLSRLMSNKPVLIPRRPMNIKAASANLKRKQPGSFPKNQQITPKKAESVYDFLTPTTLHIENKFNECSSKSQVPLSEPIVPTTEEFLNFQIDDNTTTSEVKGLDISSRDSCFISKELFNRVLHSILSDYSNRSITENIEFHIDDFLMNFDLNTLGDFIIVTQLIQGDDKCKDDKNHPHVQVAKRLVQAGWRIMKNDFIPYIMCRGFRSPFAMGAYHPDEVISSAGALIPDKSWYFTMQILPPIQRLLTSLGETAWIEKILENFDGDIIRYESIPKEKKTFIIYQGSSIKIQCPNSHPEYCIKDDYVSLNCPLCKVDTTVCAGYVNNAFSMLLKRKMREAYSLVYECNKLNCKNTTKSITIKKCTNNNCNGKMIPKRNSWEFIKELNSMAILDEHEMAKTISDKAKKILRKSRYGIVNLKPLQSYEKLNYKKLFFV